MAAMSATLRSALTPCLGPLRTLARVSGGDVSDAFRATLADGRSVFVKTHPRPPRGAFRREAEGLSWLREPRAVAVPEVLAVDESFIALAWIESGPRPADFDERLGRALATLHRAPAAGFGLPRDNYLAMLPQPNGPLPSWSEFFVERRLLPLSTRAIAEGKLGPGYGARFEALFARMPELVGPAEPPSRLHGDLWSGNVLCDPKGEPWLIDPAVYGGHREVDLSMLALFGGLSERTLLAYAEVYPLSPGHARRRALYQLAPLLVHVLLFGGSYERQLDATLTTALSARGAA